MLHQNDEASTLKCIANHVRVYIQENCDGNSCLRFIKASKCVTYGNVRETNGSGQSRELER